MRELFLQIVYGRSQSAFSEGGLVVGAGLEDLGKGLRSQVGTMYGTLAKGPRYLEMTDGYVTGLALNEDDEIIGYKFVNFGKMMDFIKAGDDANTAFHCAVFHSLFYAPPHILRNRSRFLLSQTAHYCYHHFIGHISCIDILFLERRK